MFMLSVSKVIYSKFSLGTTLYKLSGKIVNTINIKDNIFELSYVFFPSVLPLILKLK